MGGKYDCGVCTWIVSAPGIMRKPQYDCDKCILPEILEAINSLRPTITKEKEK